MAKKISRNVLTHVVLQSALQSSVAKNESAIDVDAAMHSGLPQQSFRRLLENLRTWIAGMEPADREKSVWHDYTRDNSYKSREAEAKRQFIRDFVSTTRPGMVWDLGCNTGEYAMAALEAGANYAVGFDFDHGALEQGFKRTVQNNLPLQLLFLDVANPSSNQGWAEAERQGLKARASADAILALAVVHHLAIARNIPLAELIDWITGLAPMGIIEFVPKQDPMVQELLRFKSDLFADYTEDHFLEFLRRTARIDKMERISESGRLLVGYHPRI